MTNLSLLLPLLGASKSGGGLNPTLLFAIILVVAIVAIIVISTVVRDRKKHAGSTGGAGSRKKGKTAGKEAPFCRRCCDNQTFIERTPEQQRLVDKYFIVRNVKHWKLPLLIAGIAAIVLGIVLFMIGVNSDDTIVALIIIGIVAAVVGIILLIVFKKTISWVEPNDIISHDEYEQMVKDKIKEFNVEKRGLEHLGLDSDQVREIRPLVFTGREINSDSLRTYDSVNKRIHSSTRTVTLVYFTDEQVFLYKFTFDMTCNKLEEYTSEFFYVDICDISMEVVDGVMEVGSDKVEYSTVEVYVIATNSKIHIAMENEKARYASIQAMRQKVRERKMRR